MKLYDISFRMDLLIEIYRNGKIIAFGTYPEVEDVIFRHEECAVDNVEFFNLGQNVQTVYITA